MKSANCISIMIAVLSGLVLVCPAGVAGDEERRAEPNSGRIVGVVKDGVSGEPVEGAYVGIGDFGDSGGSNFGRHAAMGLFRSSQTDKNGRFVLEKVAFLEGVSIRSSHPLIVTHPDFARHDESLVVGRDTPEVDVTVRLKRAARINVRILADKDKVAQGLFLVRLESLDGRYFIPPGGNRHLSSFASPVWAQETETGSTSFAELAAGEYRIDAVQVLGARIRKGMIAFAPTVIYRGGNPAVRVEAGQTSDIEIKPVNNGTQLQIKIPDDPFDSDPSRLLIISREPGVSVWCENGMSSMEDPRLGRITLSSFLTVWASRSDVVTVYNLPPGPYDVMAGHMMFMAGTNVEVVAAAETSLEFPRIQPPYAPTDFRWILRDRVALPAEGCDVAEFCRILTAARGSSPVFQADVSIEDEKLRFERQEMTIWQALEAVHFRKGWRVKSQGMAKNKILLQPPPAP